MHRRHPDGGLGTEDVAGLGAGVVEWREATLRPEARGGERELLREGHKERPALLLLGSVAPFREVGRHRLSHGRRRPRVLRQRPGRLVVGREAERGRTGSTQESRRGRPHPRHLGPELSPGPPGPEEGAGGHGPDHPDGDVREADHAGDPALRHEEVEQHDDEEREGGLAHDVVQGRGGVRGEEHAAREQGPEHAPVPACEGHHGGGGEEAEEGAAEGLQRRVPRAHGIGAEHGQGAEADPEGVVEAPAHRHEHGDAQGEAAAERVAEVHGRGLELGAQAPEECAAGGRLRRAHLGEVDVGAAHHGRVRGDRHHAHRHHTEAERGVEDPQDLLDGLPGTHRRLPDVEEPVAERRECRFQRVGSGRRTGAVEGVGGGLQGAGDRPPEDVGPGGARDGCDLTTAVPEERGEAVEVLEQPEERHVPRSGPGRAVVGDGRASQEIADPVDDLLRAVLLRQGRSKGAAHVRRDGVQRDPLPARPQQEGSGDGGAPAERHARHPGGDGAHVEGHGRREHTEEDEGHHGGGEVAAVRPQEEEAPADDGRRCRRRPRGGCGHGPDRHDREAGDGGDRVGGRPRQRGALEVGQGQERERAKRPERGDDRPPEPHERSGEHGRDDGRGPGGVAESDAVGIVDPESRRDPEQGTGPPCHTGTQGRRGVRHAFSIGIPRHACTPVTRDATATNGRGPSRAGAETGHDPGVPSHAARRAPTPSTPTPPPRRHPPPRRAGPRRPPRRSSWRRRPRSGARRPPGRGRRGRRPPIRR